MHRLSEINKQSSNKKSNNENTPNKITNTVTTNTYLNKITEESPILQEVCQPI